MFSDHFSIYRKKLKVSITFWNVSRKTIPLSYYHFPCFSITMPLSLDSSWRIVAHVWTKTGWPVWGICFKLTSDVRWPLFKGLNIFFFFFLYFYFWWADFFSSHVWNMIWAFLGTIRYFTTRWPNKLTHDKHI